MRGLRGIGAPFRASIAHASGTGILKDSNAIDRKAAARKAANDIAFVKRTLNTIFKDLNILSAGPSSRLRRGLDWAGKSALGRNRIGPGGGIRLELASYVNFKLGYAWHVNRQRRRQRRPVLSIGVRDLFH
ncbi:MAG: hypothetical protein ABSG03_30705 [Bryobacteraceae bacterium]